MPGSERQFRKPENRNSSQLRSTPQTHAQRTRQPHYTQASPKTPLKCIQIIIAPFLKLEALIIRCRLPLFTVLQKSFDCMNTVCIVEQ